MEPQLEEPEAAARPEAAPEAADDLPGGPQNHILMPNLDMIFAEAGCLTKHRLEQD